MVFPVNNIKFRIGTAGRASSDAEMTAISDMESFSISFDSGIESWNPIDQEGWVRRLMTSKSMTVSLSGKRNYGDFGNDYIAGLAYENGDKAASVLETIFPNGAVLRMDCVINVTASDGGNATDVGVLQFECLSEGKPKYMTTGGA